MHLQYAGAKAFFSVDLSELIGQGGLKTIIRASPIRDIFLGAGEIGLQSTAFQSGAGEREARNTI